LNCAQLPYRFPYQDGIEEHKWDHFEISPSPPKNEHEVLISALTNMELDLWPALE
jgi:hypothetical protein